MKPEDHCACDMKSVSNILVPSFYLTPLYTSIFFFKELFLFIILRSNFCPFKEKKNSLSFSAKPYKNVRICQKIVIINSHR